MLSVPAFYGSTGDCSPLGEGSSKVDECRIGHSGAAIGQPYGAWQDPS
jgi:hypothetical protein